MILLGSTSPRMTRWAHDAAARVARPVSRRPAVAALDAGNAAEQAIAVPIFLSRVARLRALRHGAHCLECLRGIQSPRHRADAIEFYTVACVVHGSMAVPRSSLSRCSIVAGPKACSGDAAIPDRRQNSRHAFAPTSDDVGVT